MYAYCIACGSNYIHVGPSYVALRTGYIYMGDYTSCLALVRETDHIRIMPSFFGKYAKYSMFFIPNCSMSLSQLHCTIGGDKAIGAGFCLSGNNLSGYVTGIEWWSFQGVDRVSVVYRTSIGSSCFCSSTLTDSQITSCYCMRGILTVFK